MSRYLMIAVSGRILMRPVYSFIVATAVLAPMALTPALAQQQKSAPQQQAAPKAAPPKPYKPVSLKLPVPMNDPAFEAFRKLISDAAQKKDRAALGKLVVAQGFFWEGENGDKADKKKSGADNLAAALGLSNKDSDGWDVLTGYAADPTTMPFPDKQGVMCAPADPTFEEKELEDLAKATQTDPGDWGYPSADGVEVRADTKPNSPVSEKLGMYFVRVLPDEVPTAQNQAPLLKIVTPSGKIGYVSGEAIAPLGNDQLCYVKDGADWKIAGFIGGEQ
jgi:hypothetical protein